MVFININQNTVQVPEIRGVWLTNTDSKVLRSHDRIQAGLQRLKELNFNTIYPVVWQRGHTLYPSPIAQSVIGTATLTDPGFSDRDMLAELIDAAKPLSMRVIPWFEYGLMTPPNAALATQHPSWLTLDQRGHTIRINRINNQADTNVWLNPCHPEVQQFFIDLITDIAKRYEIDGIQLDDHFGFPDELGYDPLTQKLYQQKHQGRWFFNRVNPKQRNQFMNQQMTQLLTHIRQTVKQHRSNCIISISPNPLAFSKQHYHADWQQWQQQGLIDELVLQVYRSDLSSFINELTKPEIQAIRDRIPVSIGILTGLRTRSIQSSTIAKQVEAVRQNKFSGISCFFYETLFYEALSPTKISRSSKDLNHIFG